MSNPVCNPSGDVAISTISSAYFRTDTLTPFISTPIEQHLVIASTMSFISILNKVGDKLSPCIRPLFKLNDVDGPMIETYMLKLDLLQYLILTSHMQKLCLFTIERSIVNVTSIDGGHKCRVWHANHALKCKRCSNEGHRTTDINQCPAYIDNKPDDVITFWEQNNVFSNFHMCNLSVFGIDFKSSEHAYQYCKLRYIDQEDLADEILLCDTPKQAKNIAAKIPHHMLIQWEEQKCEVMYQIME